jgi:hypothetical protein
MPHLVPISAPKEGQEIGNELVLGPLHQSHQDQLEFRVSWTLPDVVDKSCITSEAKVVLLTCKPVEPSIVQPLESESKNRFDVVAFGTKSLDKLSRQVFVQEYSHAAWCVPSWASSRNVLRMDSFVRLG